MEQLEPLPQLSSSLPRRPSQNTQHRDLPSNDSISDDDTKPAATSYSTSADKFLADILKTDCSQSSSASSSSSGEMDNSVVEPTRSAPGVKRASVIADPEHGERLSER